VARARACRARAGFDRAVTSAVHRPRHNDGDSPFSADFKWDHPLAVVQLNRDSATSSVRQLRPYFVRNAVENPNPAIDPPKLLIIQPFILMPTAAGKF